jgi:8-oxo-dGTP pyrophosphatase MutT (NUDIX family)
MGAHTSNAGRIYFASGTPDPHDKRADGTLDLEGSALRELYEETGLAPKEVTTEPRWTVVFSGSRVACMKSVHSPLSADEIMERFAAFAAAHATPELAGLHSVYTERDLDLERMPDFTVSYLRYALAKASAR